jgi:hypothetical protein
VDGPERLTADGEGPPGIAILRNGTREARRRERKGLERIACGSGEATTSSSGEIFNDLMARGAAAPDFPYGSSDGHGAGAGPLAYRGPHGVLLVEWLIGPPNLLASATQLQVSNGLPIIYIDAGQIAG